MNDEDKHLIKLSLSALKRHNRALKRALAKEVKRLEKLRQLTIENMKLAHKLYELRDAKSDGKSSGYAA